ncbi:MAG: hypothetical protein H6740_14910 [Alphaproteobacteria bacterium]|nr:hypothetical protein [Alphaproteobacteria bacterium]
MTLRAWPYRPIPYATPREALRKTLSALREPEMAQARLAYTLARPPALPIAVELQMGPWRVGLLGQALHRFLGGARRVALLDSFRDLDLLVVGTDFDDERACGELMVALRPRQALLADLVGPVRRTLGLPTRPLAATLQHAPADTVPLASSQSHLFQWRPA